MEKTVIKFTFLYFFISIIFFFSQSTNAYFTDTGETSNNSFSAICWTNPIATNLALPADDTNSNATDITFDWTTTTSNCPIATLMYNFQIYSDAGLLTFAAESGFSNNLSYSFNSIPEGEYWWRVQVKDQYDNLANSVIYHLTVDRTAPTINLSIAGSWEKSISEKITDGGFETDNITGWTTAGNVALVSTDAITDPAITVSPYEGSGMVRIGNTIDPGNYVWENRLMQSFDAGAKSISLQYNYFSRDTAGWDTPGFFIRLNGQEILRKNSMESDGITALSTGWNNFYYDLSNHTETSKINLAIYAGNTQDTNNQSWVYVDNITTYFISAQAEAIYSLSGTDMGGSGISQYKHRVDGGIWTDGSTFTITTPSNHLLQYFATDKAGNASTIKQVQVMTDATAPNTTTNLTIISTTNNSVTLEWNAPGNDGDLGKAVSYDIRYSTTNITNNEGFNAAIKVEKVPSPQDAGSTETLEILGLNPETTYYFAMKTSDEAPNTSSISNIASGMTDCGFEINYGDIVINELIWMGSAASKADEWLELRNMTNRNIDLSNVKLTGFDGATENEMAISFTGKSIAPNGYFLIANTNSYASGDSHLKSTVIPDIWDSSLELSNDTLMINLYWNNGSDNIIDTAWNGTPPKEGLYDTTPGFEKYYSMERTAVPGEGTSELSWYTCIDTASSEDFFDGTADERGTPGSANRSENEPLTYQLQLTRPTPTPTIVSVATPEATLTLSNDKKTISFFVQNIEQYNKLFYELSYDAFSSAKGIVGSDIDISTLDKFEKTDLDLATCSSEICTYDQEVKDFKLIITLTDKDGKEAKLEKDL